LPAAALTSRRAAPRRGAGTPRERARDGASALPTPARAPAARPAGIPATRGPTDDAATACALMASQIDARRVGGASSSRALRGRPSRATQRRMRGDLSRPRLRSRLPHGVGETNGSAEAAGDAFRASPSVVGSRDCPSRMWAPRQPQPPLSRQSAYGESRPSFSSRGRSLFPNGFGVKKWISFDAFFGRISGSRTVDRSRLPRVATLSAPPERTRHV